MTTPKRLRGLGEQQRSLLLDIYERTCRAVENGGRPWVRWTPRDHFVFVGLDGTRRAVQRGEYERSWSASISRSLRELCRRGLMERANDVTGGARTTFVQLTVAGVYAARSLTNSLPENDNELDPDDTSGLAPPPRTMREVAQMLGQSPKTMYRWLRRNEANANAGQAEDRS